MKNIFLYLGPEEEDAQEKINELYAKAAKSDTGIERKHLYGFDSEDLDIAISDIMTPSLFGSGYFIILDAAEEIGEKDAERMAKNISSCSTDTYLILRSKENRISSKLEKCVKPDNKKVFYLMQAPKKKVFVQTIFSQKGFAISPDAIEAFLSLVDEDKKSLVAACKKVLSFVSLIKDKKDVNEEDVYKYLQHDRDEDGYSVFYYIAQRNPNALMMTIENILNTNPRGFSLMIPTLIICLRRAVAYMNNTNPEPWVLNYISSDKVVIRNPAEKSNILLFCKNYSQKQARDILNFVLNADVEVRKIQPVEFQKIYFETKLARLVTR